MNERISKKTGKKKSCRLAAFFIIYLLLGSLISVDIKAEYPDPSKDKEYYNRLASGTLTLEDLNNPHTWTSPYLEMALSNKNAYPAILKHSNFKKEYSKDVPKEYIKDIPADKVDVAQVKEKSELRAHQLIYQDNLELVGDLSSLNAAELNKAIIQKHSLHVSVAITVVRGVTYKGGKLFNPNFKSDGFYLATINNNPNIIAIVAVDSKDKANENGFVILEKNSAAKIILAQDTGLIKGFEFDQNGNVIVHGTKGDFTLSEGQVTGVKDAQGNSIFLAKEEVIVNYRGMSLTAHGSSGKETTFDFNDKESKVTIKGAATLSGSFKGQSIRGTNFDGDMSLKFDEGKSILSIGAKQAEIRIDEDYYSGHFSANYKEKLLTDFSLDSKSSSAAIRGHSRITNEDSIPKTFLTQFHPDGDRVEQVWHNSAILITFNEERVKVSELNEDQVRGYVDSTLKQNQKAIETIEFQLSKLDRKKDALLIKQLERQKEEMASYDGLIQSISSKNNLLNIIGEKITRLEAENQRMWRELPNKGLLEFNADDKSLYSGNAKTTDVVTNRIAIIPGKSSYGNSNDKLSFSGLQDGVYSIHSPAEYSRESGKAAQLEKRGIIYFQAGKSSISGDFGIARVTTTNADDKSKGFITISSGKDTGGNSYVKLRRDGIIKADVADAGIIIVGPQSKDPKTSMIKLDSDGIHAINKLVDGEESEVHSSPSIIKTITDNYKKVRDISLGVLSAVGQTGQDVIKKIQQTFAETFQEIESYVKSKSSGVSPEILNRIIEINILRSEGDTKKLEQMIESGALNGEVNEYARLALLSTYDEKGNSETADAILNTWLKESPKDSALQKIKSQRDESKKIQNYELTGQESLKELERLAQSNPLLRKEVYLRIAELHLQSNNYAKAQEYAELARRELTLSLERAEFDVGKAGFVNIFDFTEKAAEINERLVEASYYNKDLRLTEDASRSTLAIDKRNINAQQYLSASLKDRGMHQENVRAWEKFSFENKDESRLNAQNSLGLVEAYTLNKQYRDVDKVYNGFKDKLSGEAREKLDKIYVFSLSIQAKETLERLEKEKLGKEARSALLDQATNNAVKILTLDNDNEFARAAIRAAANEYSNNQQYHRAETLLNKLSGELTIDDKLALAYALSQQGGKKAAEAQKIYSELINADLSASQALHLAQIQSKTKDLKGLESTLASLYASNKLNADQKVFYAQILQQNNKNQKANTVLVEVAKEYESRGKVKEAAILYFEAGQLANAERFVGKLEKGNEEEKFIAAQILAKRFSGHSGPGTKALALYEQAAAQGHAGAQLYLAQKSDVAYLDAKNLEMSRDKWKRLYENKDAPERTREYAAAKMKEKNDLIRVSGIISKYDRNDERTQAEFSRKAKDAKTWALFGESELEKLRNENGRKKDSNRNMAISELESALKSKDLSEAARIEAIGRLTRLYYQDQQTDKGLDAVNQELLNLARKFSAETDPLKRAELQKYLSDLKGVKTNTYRMKVADTSESFQGAESSYGFVNKVFQFLTGDDERLDSSRAALKTANSQMLAAYSAYVATLTVEELKEEEEHLRYDRENKLLPTVRSEMVELIDNEFEQAQRREAASHKHSQILLQESPELKGNEKLLRSLVESRVEMQISEEDVSDNLRRRRQLERDIEAHRSLPFLNSNTGVVDKLENIPLFGGLVSAAVGVVEWTGGLVGANVRLKGADQDMEAGRYQLQAINEQLLDISKERERSLTQSMQEAFRDGALTKEQEALLQRELIRARVTNAEMELNVKQQKVEELTEKYTEGGMALYGRLGITEFWRAGTGKTSDAFETLDRESVRLRNDINAGNQVLRLLEQGKTFEQIYAENPELRQVVQGKLDNFNYDYDGTIEKTEVFERTIYDEIFNPETALSFYLTAPAFASVGKKVLDGIGIVAKSTTQGLQIFDFLGQTSATTSTVTEGVIRTMEILGKASNIVLTVASYPYRTGEIVEGALAKVPVLGKGVAAIGTNLPAYLTKTIPLTKDVTLLKIMQFAAEEMWFEEIVLPKLYGFSGRGVDIATGGVGAEQFFSETVNSWLETYHGHAMMAQFVQQHLAQQNIQSSVKSNYMSMDYGDIDVIHTKESAEKVIEVMGFEDKIASREIKLANIDGGVVLQQEGKRSILITQHDNFAETYGLVEIKTPANFQSDSASRIGIVSISNVETFDLDMLAQGLRNTHGVENVVIDRENNVVTAAKDGKSFVLAGKDANIGQGSSLQFLDSGGNIVSAGIGKEVDEDLIDANMHDTATADHLMSALNELGSKLDSRNVLYLDDGSVWQQMAVSGMQAGEIAERLGRNKNFEIISSSEERVFARDLLTNRNIVIETTSNALKEQSDVKIPESESRQRTERRVVRLNAPVIVRNDILVTSDGEAIKKVEISGNALLFQYQLRLLQSQGEDIEIVEEARSEDDIIIYTQDGNKVVVVQSGADVKTVEGQAVTTMDNSIALSLRQNAASRTPNPALQLNVARRQAQGKGFFGRIVSKLSGKENDEALDEIALETGFDMRNKEPKEVLARLKELGLIDDNLNVFTNNIVIQSYVQKIKEAIEQAEEAAAPQAQLNEPLHGLNPMEFIRNFVGADSTSPTYFLDRITGQGIIADLLAKGFTLEQIKEAIAQGDVNVARLIDNLASALENGKVKARTGQEARRLIEEATTTGDDGSIVLQFKYPEAAGLDVESQEDADKFGDSLENEIPGDEDVAECRYGSLSCAITGVSGDAGQAEVLVEDVVKEIVGVTSQEENIEAKVKRLISSLQKNEEDDEYLSGPEYVAVVHEFAGLGAAAVPLLLDSYLSAEPKLRKYLIQVLYRMDRTSLSTLVDEAGPRLLEHEALDGMYRAIIEESTNAYINPNVDIVLEAYLKLDTHQGNEFMVLKNLFYSLSLQNKNEDALRQIRPIADTYLKSVGIDRQEIISKLPSETNIFLERISTFEFIISNKWEWKFLSGAAFADIEPVLHKLRNRVLVEPTGTDKFISASVDRQVQSAIESKDSSQLEKMVYLLESKVYSYRKDIGRSDFVSKTFTDILNKAYESQIYWEMFNRQTHEQFRFNGIDEDHVKRLESSYAQDGKPLTYERLNQVAIEEILHTPASLEILRQSLKGFGLDEKQIAMTIELLAQGNLEDLDGIKEDLKERTLKTIISEKIWPIGNELVDVKGLFSIFTKSQENYFGEVKIDDYEIHVLTREEILKEHGKELLLHREEVEHWGGFTISELQGTPNKIKIKIYLFSDSHYTIPSFVLSTMHELMHAINTLSEDDLKINRDIGSRNYKFLEEGLAEDFSNQLSGFLAELYYKPELGRDSGFDFDSADRQLQLTTSYTTGNYWIGRNLVARIREKYPKIFIETVYPVLLDAMYSNDMSVRSLTSVLAELDEQTIIEQNIGVEQLLGRIREREDELLLEKQVDVAFEAIISEAVTEQDGTAKLHLPNPADIGLGHIDTQPEADEFALQVQVLTPEDDTISCRIGSIDCSGKGANEESVEDAVGKIVADANSEISEEKIHRNSVPLLDMVAAIKNNIGTAQGNEHLGLIKQTIGINQLTETADPILPQGIPMGNKANVETILDLFTKRHFSVPEEAAREIITNAYDAMKKIPREERIVEVSTQNGLSVKDTGEGMTLDTIITKLLQPFESGKESTTLAQIKNVIKSSEENNEKVKRISNILDQTNMAQLSDIEKLTLGDIRTSISLEDGNEAIRRVENAITFTGRFGIGFYSILYFLNEQGDSVNVVTSTGDEAHNVRFFVGSNNELRVSIVKLSPSAVDKGTKIDLKSRRFDSDKVGKVVKESLSYNNNAYIKLDGEIINKDIDDPNKFVKRIDSNNNVEVYKSIELGNGKSMLYITVHGVTIISKEIEGHNLPNVVVFNYPANVGLPISRDNIEINDLFIDKSVAMINLFGNDYQLMNAFYHAIGELEVTAKAKHKSMLKRHLVNHFNSNKEGVFLPNTKEFSKLKSGDVILVNPALLKDVINYYEGAEGVKRFRNPILKTGNDGFVRVGNRRVFLASFDDNIKFAATDDALFINKDFAPDNEIDVGLYNVLLELNNLGKLQLKYDAQAIKPARPKTMESSTKLDYSKFLDFIGEEKHQEISKSLDEVRDIILSLFENPPSGYLVRMSNYENLLTMLKNEQFVGILKNLASEDDKKILIASLMASEDVQKDLDFLLQNKEQIVRISNLYHKYGISYRGYSATPLLLDVFYFKKKGIMLDLYEDKRLITLIESKSQVIADILPQFTHNINEDNYDLALNRLMELKEALSNGNSNLIFEYLLLDEISYEKFKMGILDIKDIPVIAISKTDARAIAQLIMSDNTDKVKQADEMEREMRREQGYFRYRDLLLWVTEKEDWSKIPALIREPPAQLLELDGEYGKFISIMYKFIYGDEINNNQALLNTLNKDSILSGFILNVFESTLPYDIKRKIVDSFLENEDTANILEDPIYGSRYFDQLVSFIELASTDDLIMGKLRELDSAHVPSFCYFASGFFDDSFLILKEGVNSKKNIDYRFKYREELALKLAYVWDDIINKDSSTFARIMGDFRLYRDHLSEGNERITALIAPYIYYLSGNGEVQAFDSADELKIYDPIHLRLTTLYDSFVQLDDNTLAKEEPADVELRIRSASDTDRKGALSEERRSVLSNTFKAATKQSVYDYVFLREVTQNAIDEVVEDKLADQKLEIRTFSQNRKDNPRLSGKDGALTVLEIEDSIGMSLQRFANSLLMPFSSTKRGKKELIGDQGQGFFTLLKQAEYVNIRTVKNGHAVYATITPIKAGDEIIDFDLEVQAKNEEHPDGTLFQIFVESELPGLDAEVVRATLEKYVRLVDASKLKVEYNGKTVNDKLGEPIAVQNTAVGELRFYAVAGETALTQHGMYIKDLDPEILAFTPQTIRDVLLQHGIVIDLPKSIQLIQGRSDIAEKSSVYSSLENDITVASLKSVIELFSQGEVDVGVIPYDYHEIGAKNAALLESGTKVRAISPELARDLKKIRDNKIDDNFIEKYLKDENGLAQLLLEIPIQSLAVNGKARSLNEFFFLYATEDPSQLSLSPYVPQKILGDLQRLQQEIESRRNQKQKAKSLGVPDPLVGKPFVQLKPYGKSYQGADAYWSFIELSDNIAVIALEQLVNHKDEEVFKDLKDRIGILSKNRPRGNYYMSPDGDKAHALVENEMYAWNLLENEANIQLLGLLLKGNIRPEQFTDQAFEDIVETLTHELVHTLEKSYHTTHNKIFFERQKEIVSALIERKGEVKTIIKEFRWEGNFVPLQEFLALDPFTIKVVEGNVIDETEKKAIIAEVTATEQNGIITINLKNPEDLGLNIETEKAADVAAEAIEKETPEDDNVECGKGSLKCTIGGGNEQSVEEALLKLVDNTDLSSSGKIKEETPEETSTLASEKVSQILDLGIFKNRISTTIKTSYFGILNIYRKLKESIIGYFYKLRLDSYLKSIKDDSVVDSEEFNEKIKLTEQMTPAQIISSIQKVSATDFPGVNEKLVATLEDKGVEYGFEDPLIVTVAIP